MKKYLIIYSTVDGQTKSICNKISDIIKMQHKVSIVSLEDIEKVHIKNFDCIILGASIRYGKHRRNVSDFVEKNFICLKSKKTGFFSVNVVARKKEKNNVDTNPYIKNFLETHKWEPTYLEVFAGKIDYPKLGTIDKYMIKFIMWLTKGPTNTNEVYEFTDWEKVARFANKISL